MGGTVVTMSFLSSIACGHVLSSLPVTCGPVVRSLLAYIASFILT